MTCLVASWSFYYPAVAIGATQVAFQGAQGINVFGPLGGPTSSGGSYPKDPYSASLWGSVPSHLTPAVAKEVRAAGFDFVRLQVDVGPCIQAVRHGASMAPLDAASDAAIAVFEHAGVRVLLSPYFGGGTSFDQPSAFLLGTGTAAYQDLVTCEQHWGARYAALYNPASFALDPFNEPPLPAGSAWQTSIMPSLYASIRWAAPGLTLVITPENYSDFILLAGGSYSGVSVPMGGLDPRRYRNVLFTFHQFLPSVFADQGEAYSSTYKYITGLSFPPQANEKSVAVARMVANVNADASLNASQKQQLIIKLTTEIGYYVGLPEGRGWLNSLFGQIQNWCTYWGVRPRDVLLGEWAAPRQPATWFDASGRSVPNVDSSGLVQGADRFSIANYDAAVESAVTTQGFRSAVDHLDTYDLGQTLGRGANIGTFDPLKLRALGTSTLKGSVR